MVEPAKVLETSTQREPPKQKMTYEEFLAWCDEDTRAEWVDGEVQIVSPASDEHQDLARFLIIILSLFVEAHDLGVIRPAPFQMKLPNVPRGREPDVLFIAKKHLNKLVETFLDGPADLVVEIVSPESISRDRGAKFIEYEVGGVAEYWLLDPLRRQAEFYFLEPDGRYHVINVGANGVFHSQILTGFQLRIAWLWQRPLPNTLDVLRELKII